MDFRHLSFSQAPLIKTPPPGPESRKFLDSQTEHEGSAVSYPRGLPMALQKGKGATVEDVDGNIYIDFFGGAAVLNVGHSHPDVIAAATDQLSELTHSLDVPNPARRALVDGPGAGGRGPDLGLRPAAARPLEGAEGARG